MNELNDIVTASMGVIKANALPITAVMGFLGIGVPFEFANQEYRKARRKFNDARDWMKDPQLVFPEMVKEPVKPSYFEFVKDSFRYIYRGFRPMKGENAFTRDYSGVKL